MAFAFLALFTVLQGPASPMHNPRFLPASPLPSARPVMIDDFETGMGIASEMAKSQRLQARILWIDATANIDRYNTTEKIDSLVSQIAKSGFNTVVFDVKPISGQTVYKSALAPKLVEWRGQKLPVDFDPLPEMVRQCHSHGLSLFASLNAFSEGHQLFHVGPGYETPQHQTVIYKAQPVLRAALATMGLAPGVNRFAAGDVTILSSVSRIPTGHDGFCAAIGPHMVVASSGEVRAGLALLQTGAGDTLLFGEGAAGEFLRANLRPGTRVQFDTEPNFVPIGREQGGQIPLMMDPNDPEVQDHALAIVREVVKNYDVDGIVYDDRLRYSGLDGDFSEISRQKFEASIGRSIHWPDDVFKFTLNRNLTQGVQPGPYYDEWIAWRAAQLQTFLARVGHEVRSVRATAQVGVYAGSWYGDYPALGHNYAAPQTEAGFWFLTPRYQRTGTAPLMNFLIVGCYYPTATVYEAMQRGLPIGHSIESAAGLCNRLVRDDTWTYAGIELNDFKGDPDALTDALQASLASCQGVMVFDLSHDIEPDWPVFERAFSLARKAPHQAAGALTELRRRRVALDKLHVHERPVIINTGSAGTGQ